MYKNVCIVLLLVLATAFAGRHHVRPVRIQQESEMLGLCEGCHFVIGLVEQEVDGNRQQIEAYLQDVCNIVPATVRPACTQIVGSYSDELITYILNQITPAVACNKLGVCSSAPRLTQLLSTPLKSRDQNLCTECESAVFFVQLYLKSNSTITQVNQMVNQLCSTLFPSNPSQCEALAQIGVQYVLAFLNGNSPQTICSELKLCSTVSKLLAEARLRSETGSLCSLCEVVANWGENELLSVNVEDTLVGAVDTVCAALPESWSENCSQLVAGLLPQLLAQLVANYPPNTLCGLATLC